MPLPVERIDAGAAFGVVGTPEFQRMNPNAMIPVLQDGDFTLWESNVIVRYLSEYVVSLAAEVEHKRNNVLRPC